MTGNNLIFKGDMTRRVLLCRIDPRCERPDARQFKRNLRQFVTENRHHLLSATLTVLRGYVCAGKPGHGRAPYGSFEEWDALIRGALLWLDQPDPLESRERIVGNDPSAAGLRALLMAWHAVFGSRAVIVHEVKQTATPDFQGSFSDPKSNELYQALIEVASNDGVTINVRRLGRYLSRHQDRIAGEFRLELFGDRQGVALWRVVIADLRGFRGFRGLFTPQGGNFADDDITTAKKSGRTETNPPNPPNPPNSPNSPASDDSEVL